MTDTTGLPTTTSSRSSVLYALGKLEAIVASQAEAIRALPAEINAIFVPRFSALEAQGRDFEGRLRSLERRYWVMAGGGSLVLAGIGWWVELHKG